MCGRCLRSCTRSPPLSFQRMPGRCNSPEVRWSSISSTPRRARLGCSAPTLHDQETGPEFATYGSPLLRSLLTPSMALSEPTSWASLTLRSSLLGDDRHDPGLERIPGPRHPSPGPGVALRPAVAAGG